ELRRVLAQIAAKGPPLRGIMHLAGILDDGALVRQTLDRFDDVFAAKARGAWNLHRLTLDQSLDFFILFSSSAAVIGSAGQSNYAAVNRTMDLIAYHRRRLSLPASSVNWALWEGGGM